MFSSFCILPQLIDFGCSQSGTISQMDPMKYCIKNSFLNFRHLIWRFGPLFAVVIFSSCKKEEQVVFSDNNIPQYSEIPTILVENYVNRIYIDLIGREPTDVEMNTDVLLLENADLSIGSRKTLVDKLMFNTEFIEGDTSYSNAYYLKFYTDTKARLLEGVSESALVEEYFLLYGNAIQDSLNGNVPGYEVLMIEANKIKAVLDSRIQLQQEIITVDEMYRRMLFNTIYDAINMNTFNFINATFDNMFYRYPTNAEFDQVYPVIEYNGSGELFGQVISNKSEYLQVISTSPEFKEGLIRWSFLRLLSREPSSNEVYTRIDEMNDGYNINAVVQSILITDEYAGFD